MIRVGREEENPGVTTGPIVYCITCNDSQAGSGGA